MAGEEGGGFKFGQPGEEVSFDGGMGVVAVDVGEVEGEVGCEGGEVEAVSFVFSEVGVVGQEEVEAGFGFLEFAGLAVEVVVGAIFEVTFPGVNTMDCSGGEVAGEDLGGGAAVGSDLDDLGGLEVLLLEPGAHLGEAGLMSAGFEG